MFQAAEFRVLQAAHVSPPVHLGCMSPIDKTRTLVRLGGTACLFCGAHLLLPDLIDHFNREHGRTLCNW